MAKKQELRGINGGGGPTPDGSSSLLSLDDILNAEDSEYKDVEMPEWSPKGGPVRSVRLRTMTNDELIEYGEEIEGDGKKSANVLLVMRSAVNEDGTRLFSMKQLAALKAKSAKAFNRLARAALDLNGAGVDKAKEKNA